MEPGEPVYLPMDTALALALAQEESDTCPSCGYLKAICRDPARPWTDYEIHEETCQATLRLGHFHESDKWKARHDATKRAAQVSPRFREGKAPDVLVGLDIN